MSAELNPYAAPAANVDDVADDASEAEAIRREHIKHEASIKSIGTLYYLGGGLTTLALGALLFGGLSSGSVRGLEFLPLLLMLGLCLGMLGLAYGLRGLHPWVRIPTALLAAIGLLGFPFGTLINGYIMYLVLSKKGKLILSRDYADIVAATPHVKYRTSIVVWIFLGLIVLAIAAAFLLPLFTRTGV